VSLLAPRPKSSVLVVGAGLAGMTAAFHLAERGAQVTLADRAPHIGGAFLLLDHTFTTDTCGLCIALPRQPSYCPTVASEMDPRITSLPNATLDTLEGEPGAFVATVRQSPRHVDPDRCDNCGACAAVCPIARSRDRWGRPLTGQPPQKAIYGPPPRAVPFVYAIDPDICTRCGACVEACPRQAIDLEALPSESQIQINAVVLAPGFAPFDATCAVEYGWGRYANVLTTLEYERLLNRSGPTRGHPLRPSDMQPPRRIAFVHCVGSRSDKLGRPYCSTSCCMIVAKQVGLTRKVAPETEMTVYTMDVRAVGKGYERYLNRIEGLPKVVYRRELPAMLREHPEDQSLRLLTPDGEQAFDLVILAIGMGPAQGMPELAARAGVALDPYGFVLQGSDGPGSTSRPGVFVAGSALAPADVPETVTQATAAAALAAKALSPIPISDGAPSPQGQKERLQPFEQPARVGLFLCTCRGTLNETIDFGALVAQSQRLRAVAHIERLDAACDESVHATIERAVADHNLNRIVIAGCSPRLYGECFDKLMDRLGLPPRLLARADIREGAAWAHAGKPAATTVARDAVAMAVAALREASPSPPGAQHQGPAMPVRRVLVLGGGLAGMTAAITLAELGIACDLAEREAQLGGNLRSSQRTLEGLDTQALLAETVTRVQEAGGTRVWTEAELTSWSGRRGDFSAQVQIGDQVHQEQYSALIVATGAQQIEPTEYLYGQHNSVLTQLELESLLADSRSAIHGVRSVVMIQCVGSRDETHPYCSRICCAQAIKNALALKAIDPDLQVSILYRDICTMGTQELYYLQARRLGVMFIRYEQDRKPQVTSNGPDQLLVRVRDTVLGQDIALHPDLVVLSAGIKADPDNRAVGRLIGSPLDEDGFFAEAHPKLRPTDVARPGIFLCGLAYGPRFVEESITQARAAALRAALTVAQPPEPRGDIAAVVPKLCSFCGLCVTHCPYGARVLDEEERVARVVDDLCLGCGVCVVVCPNGASRQPALDPTQLLAIVDAALTE
jgi:heterodisulfide reductase subunit A